MEFRFNINDIFKHQPIVEVNQSLVPPGFAGDRRGLWDAITKVSEVVNAVGEASAAAQGLTKPITTADRLRNSEHKLYLLIDSEAQNGKGVISGMLKTGKKSLYVFDRDGHHYQVQPPCILDFYVHESRQRSGLGKRLFEHMLQKEAVEPVKLAIDRPSDKFLAFLNKHYSLNNGIKQMNNYVVFDGFFPARIESNSAQENDSPSPLKAKQSANGLQSNYASAYGRYGAPRPPCSMGQIIHNQSSTVTKANEPSGVSLNLHPQKQIDRRGNLEYNQQNQRAISQANVTTSNAQPQDNQNSQPIQTQNQISVPMMQHMQSNVVSPSQFNYQPQITPNYQNSNIQSQPTAIINYQNEMQYKNAQNVGFKNEMPQINQLASQNYQSYNTAVASNNPQQIEIAPQMNNQRQFVNNQGHIVNNQDEILNYQNQNLNNQIQNQITNNQTQSANNQIPNVNNQIPNVNNQIPNINNQIPNVNNQIPNINNQIPNVNNQIPNINNQIPNLNNQIPNVNNQIPNINNQIPYINNQIPSVNNQIPNINNPTSNVQHPQTYSHLPPQNNNDAQLVQYYQQQQNQNHQPIAYNQEQTVVNNQTQRDMYSPSYPLSRNATNYITPIGETLRDSKQTPHLSEQQNKISRPSSVKLTSNPQSKKKTVDDLNMTELLQHQGSNEIGNMQSLKTAKSLSQKNLMQQPQLIQQPQNQIENVIPQQNYNYSVENPQQHYQNATVRFAEPILNQSQNVGAYQYSPPQTAQMQSNQNQNFQQNIQSSMRYPISETHNQIGANSQQVQSNPPNVIHAPPSQNNIQTTPAQITQQVLPQIPNPQVQYNQTLPPNTYRYYDSTAQKMQIGQINDPGRMPPPPDKNITQQQNLPPNASGDMQLCHQVMPQNVQYQQQQQQQQQHIPLDNVQQNEQSQYPHNKRPKSQIQMNPFTLEQPVTPEIASQ